MTNTQSDRIVQLKNQILIADSYGQPDRFEFKTFHVTEYPGEQACYLRSVVGPIGDDGTVAAWMYRTERIMMVGKRGRVLWLNEHQYRPEPLLTLSGALKTRLPADRAREAQNRESPLKALGSA